jgi:serine phosphatase RsbU (regulator of sigma subunit)
MAGFQQHIPITQPRPYSAGDCIVLYTDGIIEARNNGGEEFGYTRLQAIIHEYRKSAPETIAKAILAGVKAFTCCPLDDDHTVLVVRFA